MDRWDDNPERHTLPNRGFAGFRGALVAHLAELGGKPAKVSEIAAALIRPDHDGRDRAKVRFGLEEARRTMLRRECPYGIIFEPSADGDRSARLVEDLAAELAGKPAEPAKPGAQTTRLVTLPPIGGRPLRWDPARSAMIGPDGQPIPLAA